MSGKIEISRELLERCVRMIHKPRDETVRRRALSELRVLLSEPVVAHLPTECRAVFTSPPAPVSVDAAKAFAKGFNTLEAVGGKYKVVMQFASSDDAFAAYSSLGKLVKELNQ